MTNVAEADLRYLEINILAEALTQQLTDAEFAEVAASVGGLPEHEDIWWGQVTEDHKPLELRVGDIVVAAPGTAAQFWRK